MNLDQWSRSMTVFEALKRLSIIVEYDGVIDSNNTAPNDAISSTKSTCANNQQQNPQLVIHIVGADDQEAKSFQSSLQVFNLFITKLPASIEHVNLVFIGPNVDQKLHKQCFEANVNTQVSVGNKSVQCDYYSNYWHQYKANTEFYSQPDCIFCFNAGIWGYDSWIDSIKSFATINNGMSSCPVVITSYNALEASDDADALEQAQQHDTTLNLEWKWKPEQNLFGSPIKRDSKAIQGRVLADNDYWQCIVVSKPIASDSFDNI